MQDLNIEIFSKMMIFSRSLWISEEIYTMAKKFIPAGPTDIYLYAGGMSSSSYGQVLRLESILHEKRYDDFDITFAHNPTGQLNKGNSLGKSVSMALKWLFYQKY